MKKEFRTYFNNKITAINSRLFILATILFQISACTNQKSVSVITNSNNERVEFGVNRLISEIENSKKLTHNSSTDNPDFKISINLDTLLANEEFVIKKSENIISILGGNNTGILYGCMELAKQIKKNSGLPKEINIHEKPEMVMRGTAIGLQKTTYLPGRSVYEYPYTPENFPWFYNKEHWIQYLDMMVENRFNALYLWNGHPFASLVKLEDYPFAVEVDDVTFQKNIETFNFITHEANKRGIWVIQMFYNIIVSKPFAEHYDIKTQDRSRAIDPVIADYTYQSIRKFVKEYPNVGLMVCLGEAINTIDDDVEWFTKTILPAVKDGINDLGIDNEPPIVLRGHDTDAARVMKAALPIYKNLYTTYKYNGESLTTYRPRAQWSTIPTALSKLGSVHISNVHILANLEPFRYGSPAFISKSIKAMHEQQGANGLHLYPQASYWDWPYTADKTEKRLLQIERDELWYKAWARYAWNNHYNETEDENYWILYFRNKYNCDFQSAKNILKAYNEFGEISPKLTRTFGISDGNRQSMLLGMQMSQLINPKKWTVYDSFIESNGPTAERLNEYIQKEINGEKHTGETPIQIINEVKQHADNSIQFINDVKHIEKNNDEFQRLVNDIKCYHELAYFFYYKVLAAEKILRYKFNGNVIELQAAMPFFEKSLIHYKKLAAITKDTYLYANSMQTSMRRVPIAGTDGKYKHWSEMLPVYNEEFSNFKNNFRKLLENPASGQKQHEILKPVSVKLLNKNAEFYPVKIGSKVNTDKDYYIEEIAPALTNLQGVRFSETTQRNIGTNLKFRNSKPVKVVVAHFNANSLTILPPPTLETNANANDRGQADIKIANALNVKGLYRAHIYTYKFETGINELKLNKGRVLILGFIDGNQEITTYDAGISTEDTGLPVDWLFY